MTKKIRLIDEEPATVTEEAPAAASAMTAAQVTKLMEFAEAIDWKLWEILRVMKEQAGEK